MVMPGFDTRKAGDDPERNGHFAYRIGHKEAENPYEPGTEDFVKWAKGWQDEEWAAQATEYFDNSYM